MGGSAFSSGAPALPVTQSFAAIADGQELTIFDPRFSFVGGSKTMTGGPGGGDLKMAQGGGNGDALYRFTTVAAPDDQSVQWTMTGTNTGSFVAGLLRCDAAGNCYGVFSDNGGIWYLEKFVAGVFNSVLASYNAGGLVLGATTLFTAIGGNLEVFINGVSRIAIADASFASGQWGIGGGGTPGGANLCGLVDWIGDAA